jgi:hypothetical protein
MVLVRVGAGGMPQSRSSNTRGDVRLDRRTQSILAGSVPMRRPSLRTDRAPGSRRVILAFSLLLCVVLGVLGAFLLGWRDQLR